MHKSKVTGLPLITGPGSRLCTNGLCPLNVTYNSGVSAAGSRSTPGRLATEGSAPRGAAASSSAMACAVTSPNRGTQSCNWAKIPGDRNRPCLVYRKPVWVGSECAAK